MKIDLQEIQDIQNGYLKTYFTIISKNGICKKSNEYAEKIDELEAVLTRLKNSAS